ncbi:MAG: SMP-30/gluconolactonase/LRE family protein [Deltaproteobacteria bacterium]|nr:SMP-30/gluconolactonase/LRE family protein [Deltaproteobacteria bacterium]
MNTKVHSTLFFAAFLAFSFAPCTSNTAGLENIVAPGATVNKVQTGFIFTEGPAADSDGNIYFSDVRASRIYLWSCKDTSISVYRENTGRANGLMFNQNGHLVVCEMGGRRVTLDNMMGKITVLADSYKGKKLNSPNDLWIDPMGGIYFSDPRYGAKMDDVEKGSMQVYYISPDHKKVARVTNDLVKPNGLIGSIDGKSLYIADAGDNKTWLYKILPDGSLSEKSLFCKQGSDGMSLDEKNNVYVTGASSISIYDHKGMKIEEILFPERPANMTFAGKERKTLFVTARTSIYTIEMAVRGAPAPLDQAK